MGMHRSGLPAQNKGRIEECLNWLQFHRLWGELPDPARQELARSLQSLWVEAGTAIYREDESSAGLYLLK